MPTAAAPVHIRRATRADVARAAPLFDAYRTFYGCAPDVPAAHAFLDARLARDESVVLLATPDTAGAPGAGGDVVGFAQLYRSFTSVSLGPITILNDLYVAPAWRRTGAARALVRAAADHAAGEGALRLDLSTQHTNAPALALYTSLGFVPDAAFAHLGLALGR